MALEMIKSDRTIKALKFGAGRLSDGGGLYLLPFVNGDSHGWRFDYTYQGKRKTLSLGVYPQVGLAQARQKATVARSMLAAGQDPTHVNLHWQTTAAQGLSSLLQTLTTQGAS